MTVKNGNDDYNSGEYQRSFSPGFFAFEDTAYPPTSCHGQGGKGQD